MTDSQKLDLILSELGVVKNDVSVLKTDVSVLKTDMSDLQNRVSQIQLHIENKTDRNIEILAENHITLINKLNEAVPAANKNLAYEVKVNYLLDRVSVLKKDMAVLKEKTA